MCAECKNKSKNLILCNPNHHGSCWCVDKSGTSEAFFLRVDVGSRKNGQTKDMSEFEKCQRLREEERGAKGSVI